MGRMNVKTLSAQILQFCEAYSEVKFYPYQRVFGIRFITSVLLNDGDEITALFCRQSGKTETVASVVGGLAIILPFLSKLGAYKDDERLQRFRGGFWVGIFAPIKEQADIPFERTRARLSTNSAVQIMKNPNLGLDPDNPFDSNNGTTIVLTNGSLIRSRSASDQSSIEGQTYHLIILEECQGISNSKIRKSIHPMAAATNGTLVKIGTPTTNKGDFYDSIQRNRRMFEAGSVKSHFQFDWQVAAHYNKNYAKYVNKEKYRLGEDSDEFRMSYRLHWILERGMFVTPDLFEDLGYDFIDPDIPIELHKNVPFEINFGKRDSFQTAGIDFGKSGDSTVVTILEQGPVLQGGFYGKRILNWLEIYGDNYESQFYQIVDFLNYYNVMRIYADATGVGDGVCDRLYSALRNIEVEPIHFSLQANSEMAKSLAMEFQAKRLRYPNGPEAKKQITQRRFLQQFLDFEKIYNGQYLVCEHPDEKGAHDDYCWSLILANSAMETTTELPYVETGSNVFYTATR